jgi:pSer/pThr/pTyr-binding forkhead associated (FHA) protein
MHSPRPADLDGEKMKTGILHFEIMGQVGGRRKISLPANRPITIGRHDASDVLLFAAHVSRKHTLVERTPDGIQVTDTSRNGTLANGIVLRRASHVFHGPNVALLIGYVRIQISFEETEAEAPAAQAFGTGPNQSEVRRASTVPPPDAEPKE